GLVGRDGALYTLGEAGWGAYLEPWMADVLVPNPFYMASVAFQWFDIPCAMPPIAEVGQYSFAAGLTQPGMLDFVAEISFAPFTINPPELHVYVSAETGDDANDGSRDRPFNTITHALASVSGSEQRPVTIHVAAGTYAQSTNGETFPLNMKSWVSLIGVGPETTVLDAEDDAEHVILCDNVDSVRIEGFTIKNGQSSSGTGGGIFCTRSSPTIRGNVISGNQARYGAGVACSTGSSPIIENNTISGNKASYYGGGIFCDYTGSAAVGNNLVLNNSAYLGGAVYYYAQGPPTIENNTISGNSARYGAGVYCVGSMRSSAGGPVASSSQTVQASLSGAVRDAFSISDCIIWGNSSTSGFTYDNDGLYRDLYACSAVYSCVEQEEEGEGNIHDDPMFVSGVFGSFYLDPQSPCVDAGSRSAVEAGLADRTTQHEQNPDAGAVDIGYHYRIPATQRPTAHIDSISPNPAVQGVDTVEFIGRAIDDGPIREYRWESNIDGLLSNQETFSVLHAAYLGLGTHAISFKVLDDEDQWSVPAIAELTVLPNPRDEVFVDAEAGDDRSEGSETAPWRTIGHALGCVHGSASTPARIHLAPGLYAPSTSGESFPLHMRSWVSVIGEGSEVTALDAEGAGHVVCFSQVSNMTLAGLTVTGGRALDSEGRGAGIFCGENSSPTIATVTISGNRAGSGGGFYCQESSPMIDECTISGNVALHDGGAIYCCESTPTIANNRISRNSAGAGGGIHCLGGAPIIENNTILRNSADWNGGGIYCSNSSPTITNNMISENKVNGLFAGGGAVLIDSDCKAEIRSDTIIGNSSVRGDGGISGTPSSALTIVDCIIWGNGDDLVSCSATYSCIEDDDAGTGNIHADPMFFTTPFGICYLAPDSPCVDAGSRSAADAGLADRTTQADGSPDTGTVDMGYHYPIP
ncbi:MAG: right-handed parallel beta-helix repeat-containing protein, partial [Candidatus Coatesbacteria bacterium]|nr:right-handed parallel beta-helix repeat-containing protein [Candidatus Coatesbacteria bacterium]